MQEWRTTRYDKVGLLSSDYQLSEAGIIACLQCTGGWRVNHIFGLHNKDYRFAIYPSKRKTDTQVCHRVSLRPSSYASVPIVIDW